MHQRHICVQRRRNLFSHNDDDNNRVSTKEIGDEETRREIARTKFSTLPDPPCGPLLCTLRQKSFSKNSARRRTKRAFPRASEKASRKTW